MKYILIAIALFFTLTPLHSQMEFEEVFKIYTQGGTAEYSDVFFKNDSIFIETRAKNIGEIEKQAYYLSTNSGETFEDISDKVRLPLPILDGDRDGLVFHPEGFFFIKRNFTDKDTSIYYISLDGEILKKVKYPFISAYMNFTKVEINDKDPDYLAIHHYYYMFVTNTYFHQLSMSTDRGETWKSLAPEETIKNETGRVLPSTREITTFYSERNKGKLFAKIKYESFNSLFTQFIEYNYLADEYSLVSGFYDIENIFNYESFQENSLDQLSVEWDGYYYQNLQTLEKFVQLNFYKMLNLDQDLIEKENEDLQIGEFRNGQGFSFMKTNPFNYEHKVLALLHVSTFGQEDDLIHNQYFFQTFDNGVTWEFIFENTGMEEQVFDFFINPRDLSLWIIKDKELEYSRNASSYHPILYKSKSPLTNMVNSKYQVMDLNIQLYGNQLVLNSKEFISEANIEVYNLTGQVLFIDSITLGQGDNVITLANNKSNQLLFIRISINEINNVFKLIQRE